MNWVVVIVFLVDDNACYYDCQYSTALKKL